MNITYLLESDSRGIKLNLHAECEESEEVAPGTVLDFDKAGNLIAIEFYKDASQKVDLSILAAEGLPVEARTATDEVTTPRYG